jgi:hypothetical protein
MALTKHEDLLKCPIDENLDTPKIEVTPQLVDNTLHIRTPLCVHLDTDDISIQHNKCATKPQMTTKTPLQKATNKLYNIEKYSTPEKTLNINLDLYQMEDY